jgi:hypothetical protein
MSSFVNKLLQLYWPLVLGISVGWVLGQLCPPRYGKKIGQGLYWVGVPISVFAFLRQADLSGAVWIAPIVAWVAILAGLGLSWLWIQLQIHGGQTLPFVPDSVSHRLSVAIAPDQSRHRQQEHQGTTSDQSDRFDSDQSDMPRPSEADRPQPADWKTPTRGSFLLTSMVGNTGYLGYPVVLALVGSKYFGWAVFYDLLGTMIGAYGLGVVLAARYGSGASSAWQTAQSLLKNPTLWSFFIGLALKDVPFPSPVESVLEKLAWVAIALSLVLIGMRLSQISSWQHLPKASISLGIKMLIVPLAVGLILSQFSLNESAKLIIILEMAMPPAFATLVISEAFELDRDLTVTSLVAGTFGLLLLLPLWLWLFG